MSAGRVSLLLLFLMSYVQQNKSDPLTEADLDSLGGVVWGSLGRALTVRCPVPGALPSAVRWYRGPAHDVTAVPGDSALYELRGPELRILQLTTDTLGPYECQVTVGAGRAAKWRVELRAREPPASTSPAVTSTAPPASTAAPVAASNPPNATFNTCYLKSDRGSCLNFSAHWFYDTEYGGCSRFWYGGCEGNGNRFSSKEECEAVCVSPPSKGVCRLPKIMGVCFASIQRWYYDTELAMCSSFIYGGCLGNGNNFESRELCETRCGQTETKNGASLV